MIPIVFAFILLVTVLRSDVLQIIPEQVAHEAVIMLGDKFDYALSIYGSSNYKFNPYEDVEFELYTQKNPVEFQRVLIDNPESLKASNFDPKVPTRLIIHGGNTNGTSVAIQTPRAGYMKKGDFNVFGVNWGKGAIQIKEYENLKKDTEGVGKTVAAFIKFLIREGGASMDDMAVIGHSAGGTIVSFVGIALNGTLPVIISQEPPIRENFLGYGRMHPAKSDAKYVEIIHTAIVGSPISVGHADYFINGGSAQPQCDKIEEIPLRELCDHMTAIDYYAESIYSEKGFWGKQCKSPGDISKKGCKGDGQLKKMGEPIDTRHGIYMIRTNDEPPFAMGKESAL